MSTVPDHLAGLVDDASTFPPGNLPLADAVRAHRRHRAAPYAGLVGPLVVADTALPELGRLLDDSDEDSGDAPALPVSVVVTGGAGALEPAAVWAGRTKGLRLTGLEIRLRDEDDLAHNARRVCAAVDQVRAAGHVEDAVAVHVELPRAYGEPGHGWLAALDEVAAADHRLKLRLGGPDADDVPAPAEVAAAIAAALDRELPFKCTAGLHHAVRHREDGTPRHGFLNVLLATRASLDGAGPEELCATLAEEDADTVAARVADLGAAGTASARRWFTSFGSCSIAEPLDDLVALGLLPAAARG